MKTQGIILVTLFCLSMISPLAQSNTTTSAFDDGTTSFEHKFSSAGITNAGEITMPYGAEVTEAEFNIRVKQAKRLLLISQQITTMVV